MTISEYSGPACREIRQLLGVYVVGAIDPAERAIVDDHLGECTACRDELAGLAGLPAMLGRVPAADVERLAAGIVGLPDRAEPSPELLASLLARVTARRRRRTWRGVAAVAAAAIVAAGGATAVSELAHSHSAAVSTAGSRHVASAMSPVDGVAAVVDYTATPWGSTDMRVRVKGITPGTNCQFWVVGTAGSRTRAGYWTVGDDYGASPWYSASAQVKATLVHSFEITSGGRVLLKIPAAASSN